MRYWLMKSEPDEFSIQQLAQRGREPWNGVRNYQARNFIRDDMQYGDGVLFYHSNCAMPGIVGLAEIVSEAMPDPTQPCPTRPSLIRRATISIRVARLTHRAGCCAKSASSGPCSEPLRWMS